MQKRWHRMIFSVNNRVMRSLERFNRFIIRSGTNLKATRTWHNHQLGLKRLQSLSSFQFIRRWIIKAQWLRKINSRKIIIVTEWMSENIMIATIKKFKMMNNDILMIRRIIKMGWWKMRNFTLYVSRKVRWETGWIQEEIFVLFTFKWKNIIPRVLWMIGNRNI